MLGYVKEAIHQFQHPQPARKTDAPSQWTAPNYGVKVQLTKATDTSEHMTAPEKLRLQRVVGKLLYYCRAVDSTMQHSLSVLAAQQTSGTQQTMEALTMLLNYCWTHPETVLRYHRSDMIYRIESDAAYLTEPEARSRVGGFHYMGNTIDNPPFFNGPILTISTALKAVMAAASEAECGALYVNCKTAVPVRVTLHELDHPQPATPVACDNSTATGIMNRKVKQQRSKAMDMRFYWVQDRVDQDQFRIYWSPGPTNRGDYYTKHHPPTHHRVMRPIVQGTVDTTKALEYLRGCAKPSPGTPKRTPQLTPAPKPPANQIPNGMLTCQSQVANNIGGVYQAGRAYQCAMATLAKSRPLAINLIN
jgi:hypothetical protein